MMSGFRFGNMATWDFSMHVEKIPSMMGATRKRTTFTVAGRNGDLHYTENAFSNYKQQYECYFHNDRPAPELAHAVKAWLLNSGAYQRLEDTYDPDYFRLATFAGPLDVNNHLNKYGRCTVTFDCAPQSFLKSGENPIAFAGGGVLHNPTLFTARPIITIYGSGAGTVTIGGTSVEIKDMADRLTLDCDIEDAYRVNDVGEQDNMNGNVYIPEYPSLPPDDSAISFSGGVTKVEVIPRWWEL